MESSITTGPVPDAVTASASLVAVFTFVTPDAVMLVAYRSDPIAATCVLGPGMGIMSTTLLTGSVTNQG